MENIVELPGKHTMQTGQAYHSRAERAARRKENPAPSDGERAGRESGKGILRDYSAFFLTIAQAILAGEPEEPGAATA